jgi:hypothetical protein
MHGKEDWVMRPVIAGMCKMESLLDGTLNLYHIALMNEALDSKAENERRYMKSKEKQK